MRVKGSYKPKVLEYEVLADGKTAVIRFYENVKKYTEPEGEDGAPGASGWEFDRYTLTRPHSDRLKAQIEEKTAEWLEYAKQEEHNATAAEVRRERNTLLDGTDRTQIADAPIPDERRAEYVAYRQKLRDIPEQKGFPYEVEWPISPDEQNSGGDGE